jgi:hypothetical protein
MHLTTQEALGLSENKLRDFLSLTIGEGSYIDYKVALSEDSKKAAYREFLKDVTAFANAEGGQILLGVKEPKEGIPVDDLIVGLIEGENLAHDLERLASTSIDPRIPGLKINAFPLNSGKFYIVIHIPLSLGRPHMVNHDGHRCFYVRHSESSPPMTTHEVREAVLASATSEGRARCQVEKRLMEVRGLLGEKPAFFIQAVPLITPESPWNVLDPAFNNVVIGSMRSQGNREFGLWSNIHQTPTIDGVVGRDKYQDPRWETEAHRTGYVSACYYDVQKGASIKPDHYYLVWQEYCQLFRSFCQLLKELWDVSGTDLPYLVACAYLNAKGTILFDHPNDQRLRPRSNEYLKNEILWPEHIRSTGEDPMLIAEKLCSQLCCAFGLIPRENK